MRIVSFTLESTDGKRTARITRNHSFLVSHLGLKAFQCQLCQLGEPGEELWSQFIADIVDFLEGDNCPEYGNLDNYLRDLLRKMR